ncbi:MAG TPA: polysaccharide biosynthesis/export family protein [Patescibacteria group bacterium]|nr:polysaccharide biosynthesis/export family protein [Patescibacteria group bacterium]
MKVRRSGQNWYGLFCALFTMTLLVTGCASLPTEMAPSVAAGPNDGYLLEPGNRIRVIVFNENNLSGDFTIDPVGNIFLPLVGNIPSTGVTARTLAQRMEEALSKASYLKDPKVSVEVQTFRPFFVMGEVRQPGEFPYTTGVTVLSAIAKAGGYDYRARKGDVVVIRTVNGEQTEYRGNERTPLVPGDVVKVVERYF